MRICDSHNDFLTEIKTDKEKKLYLKYCLLLNKTIKKVACVIWTTQLKNVVEKIKENVKLLTINLDIQSLKRQNKKILFCFEDIGFVVKDNKIDYETMDYIIGLKPFYCGLVWNEDNLLGGGAFGRQGLTKLGRDVVRILEFNNIIVDTAHMNRKTFYDFVRVTRKPIYNSHSNIYSFKQHKRNLTDKQINTIINSRGFIGLSFVSNFISDKIVECKDVAFQIKYFVEKFGCNNVGIGSDFFGTTNLPSNLKSYKDFKSLQIELKKQGLTNNQVKKIFYKNFLEFQKRLINKTN